MLRWTKCNYYPLHPSSTRGAYYAFFLFFALLGSRCCMTTPPRAWHFYVESVVCWAYGCLLSRSLSFLSPPIGQFSLQMPAVEGGRYLRDIHFLWSSYFSLLSQDLETPSFAVHIVIFPGYRTSALASDGVDDSDRGTVRWTLVTQMICVGLYILCRACIWVRFIFFAQVFERLVIN